jgi:hypothetical protein
MYIYVNPGYELVMQFVFREIVEKTQSRSSGKLVGKTHSRPNKKLVGKTVTIRLLVGNKGRLGKQTSDGNKMFVGKTFLPLTRSRSVKICWSGKTFADWTYSDQQCWSAKLIPDQLSVGEGGFSDQLVCRGCSAVV